VSSFFVEKKSHPSLISPSTFKTIFLSHQKLSL
jgi:hypothetical protein